MRLHELRGGRVADALAPAADGDLGAEAEEPLGHRLAEPRAAAGDEDFLARKKAVDEHQGFLPARRSMTALRNASQIALIGTRFGGARKVRLDWRGAASSRLGRQGV